MIRHVVLFKLKPGLEEAKMDWMLRETRMRLLKIPEVRSLRCACKAQAGVEWDFLLLVELDSLERLAAYRAHPEHVLYVSEVLEPNVAERLALDFESTPGGDVLFR